MSLRNLTSFSQCSAECSPDRELDRDEHVRLEWLISREGKNIKDLTGFELFHCVYADCR